MDLLTTLLSLLGIGGLGAALIFIPGLATRLLALLRGLVGLIADYPWQAACAALVAVSAWSWYGWSSDNHRNEAAIADLTQWQDGVLVATREAAHRPKLHKRFVGDQIRILGTAIDQYQAAQIEARRIAEDAKRAREQEDERKRKEHDNALPARIGEERRRAQPWIDAYRLPGGRRGKAPIDRGADGQANLPNPAFGTQEPDGPSDGSTGLVAVPVEFIDRCAVVTARLKDARDWAREVLPPAPDAGSAVIDGKTEVRPD